MPPRQKKQVAISEAVPICKGAGMTAGLEIRRLNGIFFLVDVTEEKRFAADVSSWTEAAKASAKAAVESTTRAKAAAKAIVSPASAKAAVESTTRAKATTSSAKAAATLETEAGLNTSTTKKIRDAKK